MHRIDGIPMEPPEVAMDRVDNEWLWRVDAFAEKAHLGQVRKYSGEPYIEHPRAVARIVEGVGGTREMVAAALLHDVVEDCSDRFGGPNEARVAILREFGMEVLSLVNWLTDASKPKDGNRAIRKAIDRRWIADAPAEAQTVKLADLIDNSGSIVRLDPQFARIYLAEKRLLLDVLTKGDPFLWNQADEICRNAGF